MRSIGLTLLALLLFLTGCGKRSPTPGVKPVRAGAVQWHRATKILWDPSGRRLAAAVARPLDPNLRRWRTTVHLYDAKAQRAWAITGFTHPAGITFSPKGNSLAFLAWVIWPRESVSYLVIADPAAGQQRHARLREKVTFGPGLFWSDDGQLLAVPGMVGLHRDKDWYEQFVWVGDAQAREVGWYALPCSRAEQSLGLGWLPNTHTLVGLNATYAARSAPRPAGAYLWTLDIEGKQEFQFRPLQGPVAGVPLSFHNCRRNNGLLFVSSATLQKPVTQALLVIDLAKASASFFRPLSLEGRAWLPSPGGDRVAVLELGEQPRLWVYERNAPGRPYPLPPQTGPLAPAIAWGPGPQEITATSSDRKQPIEIINLRTGAGQPLMGRRH